MNIEQLLGNELLLELKKTAFLCSRKIPASAILKCYDWAIEQREAGNCIISGFHSQIEKDVLHYLLKGNQPIIIVLARSLKKRIEPEFQKHLNEGKLLIISPFANTTKRISKRNSEIRNLFMMQMADIITVGYANPKGKLVKSLSKVNKPVIYL